MNSILLGSNSYTIDSDNSLKRVKSGFEIIINFVGNKDEHIKTKEHLEKFLAKT